MRPLPGIPRSAATREPCRDRPAWPSTSPDSRSDQSRPSENLFQAPRSGGRIHEGVDITARCGASLVAVTSGRVLRRGYDSVLYGNFVLIHGAGESRSYFYAHMSHPAPVRRGELLLEGQRVGAVGETGNAVGTGCHLHFEIHARGAPIDPTRSLARWDRYS